MKISNGVYAFFMALGGMLAVVLVVGIWAGCAAPSKKTASPVISEPARDATAAPAALPASNAGVQAAAQVSPATVASLDPNASVQKLRGVVQGFDAGSGALVVKDLNGVAQEFKVDASAKITKGGDFLAITLSDLKEGDRVTVGYRGAVVVSLHVKVAPAP